MRARPDDAGEREHLNSLTSADWATLDDVIERFETAWRRGERPQLVQGLPAEGSLRDAALLELVRGELEIRLKAGEAARVESYLERYPEIAADPELILSLVAQEYELRRRQEPHLNLGEYEGRFPQYGAGLVARLQAAPAAAAPQPAPARALSPAIDSTDALITVLNDCRLLEPHHLHELPELRAAHADPKALARALVQRGWLTPWQINQVFLRRAFDLRLGQYLLLDRLGEGGMGTVYKARHAVMRRLVALKVIRRDRLASTDSVRRFYREVRAVARLSHPNIVLAHDAQQVGGTHFLVMEYVDGADLARLLRRQGALAVGQACDYIRQAALGLQHAHEMGLVHRDVKPGNMLVTAAGQVKLLDLGLARLQLAAGEQTAGELTGEGAVMGTLDYISPEQAYDARNVDIRADVYSLGCSLYHLLAGRGPFAEAAAAQKLVHHQVKEPPPVESLRREVPPALAAVVKKMLAKKPEGRYQTPADAAAALAPFCPGGASAAPPAAVPLTAEERSLLREMPVAALVSADGATTVAVVATAPPITILPAPQTPPPRHLKPRVWLLAGGGALVVLLLVWLLWPGGAPDGPRKDLAVLDRLDPAKIPAVDRFAWQPKQLVAVLGEHRPSHGVAPYLIAVANGGKWLVSVDVYNAVVSDAKTLRQQFDRPLGSAAAAVTAGGTLLARGLADGSIEVWDLAAKDAKLPLSRFDVGKTAVHLTFSPDGKSLLACYGDLVAHWIPDWKDPKRIVRLDGREAEKDFDAVHCVAVSPDGKRGLTATPKWLQLWDLEAGKPLGKPKAHADRVTWAGFAAAGHDVLFWSANGLYRWDPASGSQTLLRGTSYPVGRGGVALSADGKHALVAADGSNSTKALQLYDLAAGRSVRAITDLDLVGPVAFLPEAPLAVCHAEFGAFRVLDPFTGGERRPLVGHASRPVTGLSFARDGRYLTSSGGDRTVREWDLETGRERVFAKHGSQLTTVLAVSPGRRYAATTDSNAITPVAVWDVAKGVVVRSLPTPEKAPFVALRFADETRLLGSTGDGMLRAWDVTRADGQPVAAYELHKSGLGAFGLRAGDKEVFVLCGGFVLHWDLEKKHQLPAFPSGGGGIRSLAVAEDGSRLYVGESDGVVAYFDLPAKGTGDEKSAPPRKTYLNWHHNPVYLLALSPDGKTLVSAAADGRVIVWDTGRGELASEWQQPYAMTALAFAPDGRHLAVGNGNGTIYLVRLRPAP